MQFRESNCSAKLRLPADMSSVETMKGLRANGKIRGGELAPGKAPIFRGTLRYVVDPDEELAGFAIRVAGDPQPHHQRIKGVGIDSQNFCSSVFAANPPSRHFQYIAHMLALRHLPAASWLRDLPARSSAARYAVWDHSPGSRPARLCYATPGCFRAIYTVAGNRGCVCRWTRYSCPASSQTRLQTIGSR